MLFRSYKFQPLLEKAIPKGCNINPRGRNGKYILDFEKHLGLLQQQIIDNKVHYVVFAHGADSHEDDDLGGHLDTKHWLKAADVFANWVNDTSTKLGKSFPVVLCLFGGYRSDNYDFVLDLHLKSLLKCREIILNIKE